MMEWEEAETREEMADGFFNFCIFFFLPLLSPLLPLRHLVNSAQT